MRNLLLLAVLLVIGTGPASATLITVSGNVSGTWSVDTVLVVGEITVPPGQSLVVNPGVRVHFTGRYKLIVQGLISAVGTANDSIIFTRAYPTEESKWRGFRFDGANSSSNLEYCRIEWAKGDGVYPEVRGGAIWINNCSPTVRHCLIANNYTHNANYNGAGGGVCCNENCNSLIVSNRIVLNQSDSGGGILVGSNCDPVIKDNLIENNQAFYAGGGIYVSAGGSSTIIGNTIGNNNSGGYGGGGINLWSATWLYGTYSHVYDNLIVNNTATDAGGGIYSRYESSEINNNTIVGNTASRGGGLYVLTFENLPPYMPNDIFWNNNAPTGPQIFLDPSAGSTANLTYCDIQGGWEGVGNINVDPLFASPLYQDYNLKWGSPCIDTAVPSPFYLDPDGTIGDIGAFFYDQSTPVRILLIPHLQPIEIPPAGGSFSFTLQVSSIDSVTPQNARIWSQARLPNGQMTSALFGPSDVQVNPTITYNRDKTQTLPPGAPAGVYTYFVYARVGSDVSTDSVTVVKLPGGSLLAVDQCWGSEEGSKSYTETNCVELLGIYPNPANPATTIQFNIPEEGWVGIEIFDVTGRMVATLANGLFEMGIHEIIFDGTYLPSGIYLCRLSTGQKQIVMKLTLLK